MALIEFQIARGKRLFIRPEQVRMVRDYDPTMANDSYYAVINPNFHPGAVIYVSGLGREYFVRATVDEVREQIDAALAKKAR
jgi:hypothetical protein